MDGVQGAEVSLVADIAAGIRAPDNLLVGVEFFVQDVYRGRRLVYFLGTFDDLARFYSARIVNLGEVECVACVPLEADVLPFVGQSEMDYRIEARTV